MNFLKKWFRRAVKNAWDEARNEQCEKAQDCSIGSVKGSHSLQARGMSFTIYKADGGHILEYNHYDEKTDRHNSGLHIVTVDQDLGQQIAHAYTLEALKR